MEAGHEAGLLLSSQQGDRTAFLELVTHYRRSIYRIAFALTRNETDARELTRDAFVLAWKNVKHLPLSRPLYPWLARSVRNLSVAFRRRRSGTPEIGNASSSPRERALVSAFSELGADEQLVLALRLVEKLSYDDIASALEVPNRTAMSRLATARDQVSIKAARLPGGA